MVALVVKNPPSKAGDLRDVGLIPESGRSSGGGHDNPHQYSCLENRMDRGAWRLQSMGLQSRTRLKRMKQEADNLHCLVSLMRKQKEKLRKQFHSPLQRKE